MKLNEAKIDYIVKSTLNSYLKESLFFEKENNGKEKDNNLKNKGYDQAANIFKNKHEEGELNYRKLASKIYGIPTDTSDSKTVSKLNSKASALRKKIVGDEAANGGNFHLNKNDVINIERNIS